MTVIPTTPGDGVDVQRDRSALMVAMLIAFPVTVVIWLGVYFLSPAPGGMTDPVARLFSRSIVAASRFCSVS